MFAFSNYSTNSKYYENLNKLVIGKMKDETGGVEIKTFVGLKPKMYSFLVDNSEHRKAKDVNKNVVATISHNEYQKCIKRLINKIQSKDHRIGTYEINKISLSYFDDKIFIQNYRYDRLALGY